jgi:hypothetical protein
MEAARPSRLLLELSLKYVHVIRGAPQRARHKDASRWRVGAESVAWLLSMLGPWRGSLSVTEPC